MDRGEKYRHGLKKEKRLVQISRELGWTAEDNQIAEELLGMSYTLLWLCLAISHGPVESVAQEGKIANPPLRLTFPLDLPAAFGLHKSMFLKTLRAQTTDEQKELFTKPAERYEIIG